MKQSRLEEYQGSGIDPTKREDPKDTCPKCGKVCKNEYGVKVHYGQAHEGSIAGIEFECDWCGKVNKKRRAVVEKSERNFCDSLCYGKWKSRELAGEANPMYGVDGEDAPAYGRTGEDHPMFGRTGLDNPMGGVTGEDHPCYAGGTGARYGSNWKRVRRDVIDRDGGVCQMEDCRMTREEHREKYNKDINVHHITPKKYFEWWSEVEPSVELEHANVPRNLITLCTKCNNRVDKYGWESPLPDSHWKA